MRQQSGATKVSLLRRVDEVCLRFEDEWQAGRRPNLESVLAAFAEPERPEALVELLPLEWTYRLQKGESFYPEEYGRRFPACAAQVQQAWQLWAQRRGPAPSTVAPSPAGVETASLLPAPVALTLPGYDRARLLGRGGMGEVFLAFDVHLKRSVALKRVRLDQAGADRRGRFRLEAEALARLAHPHIVKVHGWKESGGQSILEMEYVAGGTLEERLGKSPLAPAEAARLVSILAWAVHAAHEKGIVHRDLKPANVLLDAPVAGNPGNVLGGFPKVSDFGLAALTDAGGDPTLSGSVLGTPAFMSPEQAAGRTREIGPPTDVWALGVILYRCLTGELPFRGESVLDTLERIKTLRMRPLREGCPGVPAALEEACLACLSKDPAERPTAAALATRLEQWAEQGERTTETIGVRGGADTRRRFRRTWWMAAAAVLLAGAGLGVGAWKAWLGRPSGALSGDPVAVEPLKGFVDLQIYDERDPRRQDRWLGEPGVLPLRAGDQFCIRAGLNRPAYLYVLWIDAEGKVDLAYPRDPATKGRPAQEQPVQSLRRPEALDRYYKIPEGTAGMETVVLLALEEKLPPEVDLRAELGGLPPQRRKGEPVVWFRDGEVVRDEPNRTPTWEETVVSDPLRVTQERLRQLWQRHGGYLRAVSFANRGR